MKLIIFSYPPHFRISQYCKKFALKNLPDVTEVIYAWDDFYHPQGDYLAELRKTENVILFSEFKNVSTEPSGWLRQQFVKLQLHHKLKDEYFLILDGDTLIRNKYTFNVKTPLLFTSYRRYKPFFYFIKKCLKLKKKNDFSFVSPFFFFETDVLASLEQYSIKRHGCSVIEFYQNRKWGEYRPTPPFSEFEIYGTFATQILKKEYNYVKDNVFLITENLVDNFDTTSKNLVLHGPDSKITNWDKLSSSI